MFNPERKKACVVASILFLTLAPMAIGCGKRGSPVSSIYPEYSRETPRRFNENHYSENKRNKRRHGSVSHSELNYDFQITLLQELASALDAVDEGFMARGQRKKEHLSDVAMEAVEELRERNPNTIEIINKLENRLLKKIDGCGDDPSASPDSNDVIIFCRDQAPVYEKCVAAIRSITCGHVTEIEISADVEPVFMKAAGDSAAFSATAYFAEAACEGMTVTKYAAWASSDPSVAEFSGAGEILFAHGNGATYVTAAAFGIDSSNEIAVDVSLCDEVVFEDPGLEAAIRTAAGYAGPAVGPICAEYVAAIKQLFAGGIMTSGSFRGIESLKDLRLLNAQSNGIADISPLSALKKITNLRLDDNRITDLTPLSELTQLASLKMNYNEITNLAPLRSISSLIILNLNGNNITSISPLASHANITQLYLDFNSITDISAIAAMRNLAELRATNNNISDISALAGIQSLKIVALNNNNISDLAPLGNSALVTLSVSNNPISSLAPIAGLTGIRNLAAENALITDISLLAGFPNLESIVLNYNMITSVASLKNALKIKYIGLRNNMISNIADLAQNPGIGSGDNVVLRGNPLDRDSIDIFVPELVSRGAMVYR